MIRGASIVAISFCLFAAVATPQVAVPPPPKPADSGPSLEVTMKFIQDKLNGQGRVGYVSTRSDQAGIIQRHFYQITEVVADPAACTLHRVETRDTQIEVPAGQDYMEGGKSVTGDDLVRKLAITIDINFKDIKDLSVESEQDATNRQWVQAAHPEIVFSYTPEVFRLALNGTGQVFPVHRVSTVGKQAPKTSDSKTATGILIIRDADTADRLAKAFTHAIELCGGGNKDPF